MEETIIMVVIKEKKEVKEMAIDMKKIMEAADTKEMIIIVTKEMIHTEIKEIEITKETNEEMIETLINRTIVMVIKKTQVINILNLDYNRD